MGDNSHTLYFSMSKNVLVVVFFPKNTCKFGTKNRPFWENLETKLESRAPVISSAGF